MANAGDSESLSGLYQIIAISGAAVAGGLTWVFGKPRRRSDTDEDRRDAEIENLRRTAAELQSRLERKQTDSDIQDLRSDLEKVIGAMREAILTRMDVVAVDLAKRLSDLERVVYGMKDDRDQRRRDRSDEGNR